jgi:uncharacterized protein (TIGR02246 family)
MSDTEVSIAAADDAFMDAFAQGDAAGIADLYTDDGQLFPTHSDVISGRAAIEGFWKGAMDMGIASAILEMAELDDLGDTAIETGQYTLVAGDGQTLDRGKYLVVWKNEGGAWKLHRDIWNSSASQ